jgi:hypothetical protein
LHRAWAGKARQEPHQVRFDVPSYGPQLDVIPRIWRLLRRRATHDRLFDRLADLKRSIRTSLCESRTVRGRIRSLVAKGYTRPENPKASAGLRKRRRVRHPRTVARSHRDGSAWPWPPAVAWVRATAQRASAASIARLANSSGANSGAP